MAALTTAGSTVFRFVRAEKTWKETGSGNVTFSLQTDKLVVSVGELVYVVQGGVRPKGSKAVVMRVKEDSAKNKKVKPESMIIAVRFEHLRDSKHVFSLLKLTPWIRPRQRTKPVRGPPPPFFLAMSTRERENVKTLISRAKPRYLEDGTIQRQLMAVYKMTQEQIDEAVDYFHPYLSASESMRKIQYREPSFSRTDVSSLPSVGATKSGKLIVGRKSSSSRRLSDIRAFPSNKSFQLRGVGATQANQSRPGSTLLHSEIKTSGAVTPKIGRKFHSKPDVEGSPFKLDSNKNEKYRRSTREILETNHQKTANQSFEDGVVKVPDVNIRISRLKKSPKDEDTKLSGFQNFDIHLDGQKSPRTKQNSPQTDNSPTQPSVQKPISPLTEDNLVLHNRLLKPSKGDFKRTVSLWLKESLTD